MEPSRFFLISDFENKYLPDGDLMGSYGDPLRGGDSSHPSPTLAPQQDWPYIGID